MIDNIRSKTYDAHHQSSSLSSPASLISHGFDGGVPFNFSIAFTTSIPSRTSPKTTCFPSRCEVTTVVMKNWLPLVSLPAFAIERRPGLVCLILKFSSLNFSPYIDFPPVPSPLVKSPPWIMNDLITRWNLDPLYPKPFSPVQSARKFSAVFGTTSPH